MRELTDAKYISLTTYKRDGSGVATPVWITGSDDTFLFTTGDQAWKTRRLHNDPRVEVAVSDMRGRVAAGATIYTGTGAVKPDAPSVAAAERAISQKYGWQFKATKVVDRVRARFGIGAKQAVVAIELTLAPRR
jgi:PPOX class probable F420-dependent enzyme